MSYKKQYKHAQITKTGTNNSCLYLSGGGDENQSFTLDKFFFNKIPQGGSFLYIPVALRGHKLYSKTYSWMRKVLKFHQREDVNFFSAEILSNYSLSKVKDFDAVYIGGGNTWTLIEEVKNYNFHNILLRYLKKGGIIYGGSAGAIIMGKRIDTQGDENKNNVKNVSGLNFLHNFSLTCHFKNEKRKQFREWAVKNNASIICLPEETGLIVDYNKATCIGNKPCTIFFPKKVEREIKPLNSFKI